MKHILEYNKYKNEYKVIDYDDNFDIPDVGGFHVTIEGPNGQEEINADYELFLSFVEKKSPELTAYLDKREELNDYIDIFGELQELGFDFKEYLQKWVDEYINEETLLKIKNGNDGLGDIPRWWEEEDDED